MTADPASVATAHLLLTQLGVTLADLHDSSMRQRPAPTIAEYLPRVVAAVSPSANRLYGTYWNRMAAAWGDRPLDTITASDVEALQREAVATARRRRSSRGGHQAGEHIISAARAVFNRAIADGLIDRAASPAHWVPKPRRLPSVRRALTADELEQINAAARTTGNDVVPDALLLRLHTETACRRGGALGLRVMDLDVDRGLVRLTEKGGTLRWQPVTLDLATRLADHAHARGARLTYRRYDHLWHRLGERLPWVTAQGVSIHWLRHTTLTWVDRHFGYGIARAFAGHTDTTGAATTTYIKADLQAVATALTAMTGQPHPLATTSGPDDLYRAAMA